MSHRKNLRIWLAISMFLVAMAGLAQATTVTVGPGTGYDFDAVQAGIDAAIDADTVLVAPGEYVITEPITFRGKAVTVISEAGPDATTIRMGTPADPERGSVVVFESDETTASILDGFTISGGSGSRLIDYASVTALAGLVGGGILFDASSGTVRNCAIEQNRAESGGGVLCAKNSSMTMTDCIVRGNSATGVTMYVDGYGGGLCCIKNSCMTVTDCTIAKNYAGEAGGGVGCFVDSSMVVRHCAIIGNTAQANAGGLVVADRYGQSSGTVTNCVIARNTGVELGAGGVMCSYPNTSLIISNCTIWGNSGGAQWWGGGGVLCRQASMKVTNCIIWGNTSPKGREISVEDPASTLIIEYSNVAGGQTGVSVEGGCTLNWSAGNIDADPLFARIGHLDDKGTRSPSDDVWLEGDYHLKSQAGRWDPETQTWVQDNITSPCIDAGDPMSPIGWELFPNGGFVNMGAYGGTPKASKSYFGEPICETIVAGDINGDGQVNRADLEIMALHWTDDVPLPLP